MQLSGQPRARRPVGPFRYTTLGCCTVSSPSVGVESVRWLSAVSRRTSGSRTARWSTWSSLASANGIVPQSLPSEKRKVAGSIPALATRYAQVSGRLVGLASAGDGVYPPKSAAGRPSAWCPEGRCRNRTAPDMSPIGADQNRLIAAWPRSAGDLVHGFGNETRRNCRDGVRHGARLRRTIDRSCQTLAPAVGRWLVASKDIIF